MVGTRNHYFKQSKPDSVKYHVSLHEPVCKCMCVYVYTRRGIIRGEANILNEKEKRKGVCLFD